MPGAAISTDHWIACSQPSRISTRSSCRTPAISRMLERPVEFNRNLAETLAAI
jgi:hypothetical protein